MAKTRVYTKTVFDIASGSLIEWEGYDYEGPWALCGKGSPPPPPDYQALAAAQGAQNVEAGISNAVINRPNEFTPYGSRTWTETGQRMVGNYAVPQYRSDISLTPTGQTLFDKDTQIKLGLADAGNQALSGVRESVANPLDLSSLPQGRDAITDAMYQRQTRLLDPQFEQLQRKTEGDLLNRGFSIGNEGYTRAMDNFARQRDAAYADARDRAITSGSQIAENERKQAINEILLKRQQPLAELASLRTGAAPQQPQFQPFWAGANIQPAPTFQAGQAQYGANMDAYNANAAQGNNALSGLFQLGAAAAPVLLPMMSDRRAKRNIQRIGQHASGYPLYSYQYLWSDEPQIGVMADEVPTSAVVNIGGWLHVDYGRL